MTPVTPWIFAIALEGTAITTDTIQMRATPEEAGRPDWQPTIGLEGGVNRGLLHLSAGIRRWGASWQLGNLDLDASVWNFRVDAGIRARTDRHPERKIHPILHAGGGLIVSGLVMDLFADRTLLTPHAQTGFGASFGAGRIRPSLEIRADATLRGDYWYGMVELSEGTQFWYWHPGNAGVRILLGIEWGRRVV